MVATMYSCTVAHVDLRTIADNHGNGTLMEGVVPLLVSQVPVVGVSTGIAICLLPSPLAISTTPLQFLHPDLVCSCEVAVPKVVRLLVRYPSTLGLWGGALISCHLGHLLVCVSP